MPTDNNQFHVDYATDGSSGGSHDVTDGSATTVAAVLKMKQEFVDAGEWAHFNPGGAGHLQYEARRKSEGGDSLCGSVSESVGSSIESEMEESVWKINAEQREYYTNQFKKIQPNIRDVIKGQKARDFFLKSNLPNETLSTIWQLSDMDKDAALDLNEFCIAMHLVVAVKHGVDLPTVLPFTLCGSVSEEHLVPDDTDTQAASEEGSDVDVINDVDDDVVVKSVPDEAPSLPDSPMLNRCAPEQVSESDSFEQVYALGGLSPKTNKGGVLAQHMTTPSKDIGASSVSNVGQGGGAAAAIARPRASAQKNKVVNLMDSAPWQLLPPPSSAKGKPSSNVKKTLDMDDEASFMSNDSSFEQRQNSSMEHLQRVNHYYSTHECEGNHDNRNSNGGLSKEKSRSIDSLRQEMSEDYAHMEMRRISQGSRPRSYSGDVTPQSNNNISKRVSKEIEMPPLPPPRHTEAHISSTPTSHQYYTTTAVDTPNEQTSQLNNDTSPTTMDTLSKGLDNDNTPSSLLSQVISGTRTDPLSSRQMVRFSEHLVVEDGTCGEGLTHIDKKVHKHELQSRIRMLKDNNLMLSSLVSQLHCEWKTISEERIALDVLLQKEKQTWCGEFSS